MKRYMTMNKLFHFFLAIFVSCIAFSQEYFDSRQDHISFFIDKYGYASDSVDAEYTRHIRNQINDTLYAFEDYYLSGELYQKGQIVTDYTIKNEPTINNKSKQLTSSKSGKPQVIHHFLAGDFTQFYKNGNRKKRGTIEDGRPSGIEKEWYENGQLKSVHTYDTIDVDQTYFIIDFYDSLGRQLVKDGNGVYINRKNSLVLDSGLVQNWKKEGIWTGRDEKGKQSYKEQYKLGKLLSGVSYDSLGNEYQYDKLLEIPVYNKKGLPAFYKFIGSYIKYPRDARRKRIEGITYVMFVVDKKGKTTNIQVIKGIHPKCDEITIKAIDEAKFKTPGERRGQVERIRLILPITFQLDY